jgi:adenylosuccinate lyase
VQRNAMKAWREELNFRELIASDPDVTSKVDKKTLEKAFDLNRQLRNVDKLFKRVFGKNSASKSKKKLMKKK